MNSSQWAGNYQSAGVTGIEMDLINLGNFDLTFGGNFDLPIRLVAGAFVSDESGCRQVARGRMSRSPSGLVTSSTASHGWI